LPQARVIIDWRQPWTVLDVAPDADAATIRRAYAKQLKAIRPDEDAAGFQALVEARDAMLHRAANPRCYRIDADEERLDGHAAAETPAQSPAASPGASAATGIPPEPAPAPAEPDPAPVPVTTGITPPMPLPRPLIKAPPATSPEDILDLLEDGLKHISYLDAPRFEAALGELPAGALRWHESDVIRRLAHAATKLGSQTFPPDVHDAYEIVAVRLTELFGWGESDRAIHEALAAEDAHILLVYLGRAHRRHAPQTTGRFARPLPAPARSQSRFNWRSLWLWCFLIYVIAQVARCAGDARTSLPVVPPAPPPYPVLADIKQHLMTTEALQAVLAMDPQGSLNLLIKAFRPGPGQEPMAHVRLASLRQAHVAAGHLPAFEAAIERIHADPNIEVDRAFFERYRAARRLDHYGWAKPEGCDRRGRSPLTGSAGTDLAALDADLRRRLVALAQPLTWASLLPIEVALFDLQDVRAQRSQTDAQRQLLIELVADAERRGLYTAALKALLDRHLRCVAST
jgi:hypothetical protein